MIYRPLERVKSWFVLMMVCQDLAETKRLLDYSYKILHIVQDEQDERKAADRLAKLANLRTILQPIDPARSHKLARRKRLHDTGAWFLDGVMKAWQDSLEKEPRTLWLHGKSGSGKSTLHCATIDRLSHYATTTPNTGLAYFYCSFADQSSQHAANILGSILWQIFEAKDEIAEEVANEVVKLKEMPTCDRLRNYILHYAKTFNSLFIAVDAVNECAAAKELLEVLLILPKLVPSIRLVITSVATPGLALRDLDDILSTEIKEVQMDHLGVHADIQIYIEFRLKSDQTLQRLKPEMRNKIRGSLVKNADIM